MSRRGERGFTVIEMLVALALVLLGLVLAVQMLLESRQLFLDAERRAQDPVVTVAVAQLRKDLEEASGAQPSAPIWSSGVMALEGLPAGTVVYERRGSDLVRAVRAADGTEKSARTLLRPVASWRWRSTQADLVDVEIEYVIHDPVPRLRTSPEAPKVKTKSLALRVALRGVVRSRRW